MINRYRAQIMVTIMCMLWERDKKYLTEFIRHHSSIGIGHFLFIIDEYVTPFNSHGSLISSLDASDIEYVWGISIKDRNVQRQRENYNYYLHKIKTDYVCVIDVDEFLHPKTLNFLRRHQPQAISLPWRMMVYNKKLKKISKRNPYSGILIPQKKSISRVRDIDKVEEHECTFKYEGKRIGYQNCTHIPINHFYIRDMQHIQDIKKFSSNKIDKHFESRLPTMSLLYAICTQIYEHQAYINLTGNRFTDISEKYHCLATNKIKKDSLAYLYAMIKITIWISIITQTEQIAPPRTYPAICTEITSAGNSASQLLKAIKIIFKIYRKMIQNNDSLKSAIINIYS